jgi:hypothetical protein
MALIDGDFDFAERRRTKGNERSARNERAKTSARRTTKSQ